MKADDFLASWHYLRVPLLLIVFIVILIVQRRQRFRSGHSGHAHNGADTQQDLVKTSEKSRIAVSAARNEHEIQTAINESNVYNAPAEVRARKAKPASSRPKKIIGSRANRQILRSNSSTPDLPIAIQPLVFFSSLGGSTEKTASDLVSSLSLTCSTFPAASRVFQPQLLDLSYIDYDDYFTAPPKPTGSSSAETVAYFYLILIPTYNIDTILDTFIEHLRETHHDFRIDTAPLSPLLGYTIFGFGDKEGWPTEEEGFCSQAREVDQWLSKLTAGKRAYPVGMGDCKSDADVRLGEWRDGVVGILKELAAGKSLGEGWVGSGDAIESDVEEDEEDMANAELAAAQRRQTKKKGTEGGSLDDLENLGRILDSSSIETPPLPIDFTTALARTSPLPAPASVPKEMVPKTSPTYAALTKQGYTIVGSHSGVKICRWTKSALRGRGSCYKNSFYGIKSHLCMEATPSLSCANKCVFCWRHGTNPVGTTWRWQVDPPDLIFAGAKAGHYQKIRMLRGVPGVRAERFAEALRIRHCALSLVGEPIFYPHIDALLALLHRERISSFLVCNAQHPAQLAALGRVTQLYVSVDAADRESLRRVDRPLHRDFWERFLACMDILRAKRHTHRTVFRLTLVKGFNVEAAAEGYADLVARARPCFVEVKGVTYCGTSASKGAGLTMANVPFYDEVCTFVRALDAALARRGLDYGIAAEHAHSCCVLLASERFRRADGRWCTVIDYGRFFECLESGQDFAPEDYMAETPEWAAWGRGGFDPADVRVDRKGRVKEIVALAPPEGVSSALA